MRRLLLKRLPQLCRFYGLKPPDIDEMTTGEVSEFVRQMDRALEKEGGT